MSVLNLGVDYTHGVLKLLLHTCISEQEQWVTYALRKYEQQKESLISLWNFMHIQ